MSASFGQRKSAAALVSALAEQAGRPMSAMIEIADRCNEKCVHCYQIQGQKGEMTTEEIYSVLDQLAEQGILFLTISGGEATLRDDFLEIVAYARRKKFAVKIFTNGLRVDQEMANDLGALAVQEVQISLYSSKAEAHDSVTRVPGSFVKSTLAARYLLDAGVGVVLKTPLLTHNEGDHEDYISLCEDIGADYMFDPSMAPREDGDLGPLALAMKGFERRQVLKDARVTPPESAPDVKKPLRDLNSPVCGACRGAIHVEANGELRPCASLSVAVGNLQQQTLSDALASNQENQFIHSLTWNDLHGCRRCVLNNACGRCFETARSAGGDALGPYSDACEGALENWSLKNGTKARVVGPHSGVGPYEVTSKGFRVVPYELSEDDREKRREHPWITERETRVAPTKELVQIRRGKGGDTLSRPAATLDV